MIKFDCKNCGQNLSVPEIHAGKKGKCPKCKNVIFIPQIQDTSHLTTQSKAADQEAAPKDSPFGLTFLDVPKKDDKPKDQLTIQEYRKGPEEEPKIDQTEPVSKRKLPWVIDIFLYPASTPGLTTFGIITITPLLIDIAAVSLGPLALAISIPALIANIAIGLYLYWYIAECIRDSAAGGLRAPETLGSTPGLGDMSLRALDIVGCLIVFWGPMGFYFLYTHKIDAIFWSLFAYAVFFFPMGLLSVLVFDSFSGLNPVLLIGSICSTFFPYCAMVVAFLLTGFLIAIITPSAPQSLVLDFLIRCIHLYLLLVAAHLLGRFYWRYQDKLRWDV